MSIRIHLYTHDVYIFKLFSFYLLTSGVHYGIIKTVKEDNIKEEEIMKYNLSKIMKRAWELVKKMGMTISSGLKKAWEEAKHTMIKFEGTSKIAIVDANGECNPNCGTKNDDESNYLTFKMWEKYGHKRVYVSDYKNRTVGYINCNNSNQIVSEFSKGDFFETMKWFVANYEF